MIEKNMVLKIIGTSHIAKQSINEIKEAFEQELPDIIAIELDIERATSLMEEEKEEKENQKRKISATIIPKIGLKGYLFAKIGQYAQQKLGQSVNVTPGAEMKTAITLAAKNKKEVAFIDQPITITLKNFSKQLTWKEKYYFLSDIIKGLIFPKKMLKQSGLEEFDLRKVPQQDLIIKLIKQLRHRYPSIYKTLIEDRNKYMVKKLIQLMRKNPDKKILAIVGAGHLEGMNELLLKVDVL